MAGLRREIIETVVLVGILGAGVGQLVNGRDSVQEIRDLRSELQSAMSRLNDLDGTARVMTIRLQQHDSQLGDHERRLQLLEEKRRQR